MISTTVVRKLLLDRKKRLHTCMRLTSFFSKLMKKNFGVTVRIDKSGKSGSGYSEEKTYLVLSNHLSYLDIFLLFSEFPACFIASVDEVRETFLLGRATELSGGFFVERRNRTNLRAEIESIADILKMGLNVVLFPEGTTSNGEQVLPFKVPLLSVAQKAGVEILPVCIRYTKINGEEVGLHNRDLVYYYGDMEFFTHADTLLTVKSIDAELKILDPVDASSSNSRKDLAFELHNIISSAYRGERRLERA
ncbi:MAG: 1-acyl-sn-glycerol-3-phosphate acyltransferase [Candidatus Dadabacteria bacterium]|nr:1-acyl-sn-glycerol-3-phosphate acyltransferase [Candidatus Dadabacteria bacterium]